MIPFSEFLVQNNRPDLPPEHEAESCLKRVQDLNFQMLFCILDEIQGQ